MESLTNQTVKLLVTEKIFPHLYSGFGAEENMLNSTPYWAMPLLKVLKKMRWMVKTRGLYDEPLKMAYYWIIKFTV